MVQQLTTKTPVQEAPSATKAHQLPSNYDEKTKIWSGNPNQDRWGNLSMGQLIFREMERNPQLIAQISATEGTVLTRRQLQENAMRVASYMRNMGVGQQQVVGLMARHTTHMSAVAYACFFNGTPVHCLHKSYELATIAKLYGLTRPSIVFCDGDEYEKVKKATAGLAVTIVTMRNHQPGSVTIDAVLATPIEENFQPAKLERGNDQTMAILCSSGTTGTPKAVTISNSHLIIPADVNLASSTLQYSYSTPDWISGLIMILLAGAYSTTSVVADNEFDPDFVCRLVEKYKVELFFASSPHAAKVANCKAFESVDLSRLRYFFYGGANCSQDVQQRVRQRIGRNILHFGYGITELNASIGINFNYDAKPASVGRPLRGIQVKVLGKDGQLRGPKEVGEICVYNGQHWSGYYGNPQESGTVRDAEQWFHTGDLGYLDEDGYIFLIDRIKDMLKYQNHMYYPSEIEEVIAEIEDVVEACVFGVYRAENGDEAAAAVVLKSGSKLEAQDIVQHVRKHIDAEYKQLHAGALIVEDLKRSGNGKTNRRATKAHFLEATNTQEDR
ncbi:hypothetical protein KR018_004654 [Drosophila ironensis]|nr:hypothetical protein KR018_004654 [Drosophila ironensis]